MSEKHNITGSLLAGINEFDKELEPKLSKEKITINEWIYTNSGHEHQQPYIKPVIVIDAEKYGKKMTPMTITEFVKFTDFPTSSRKEKDDFLEEILESLMKQHMA